MEELEPTAALVGDGARGHRTALEEGDGVPPPSKAPRSAEERTEDQRADIDENEEAGCMINHEPWRVSTKNGLDSGLAFRTVAIATGVIRDPFVTAAVTLVLVPA